LRSTHLQPVIQYAAACGLHPDLVTRLALVELGVGPPGEQPLTWDAWVTQSRRVRGVEFYNGALIGTPQGGCMLTVMLSATQRMYACTIAKFTERITTSGMCITSLPVVAYCAACRANCNHCALGSATRFQHTGGYRPASSAA
jgi:hypothetical protein